MTQIHSTNLPAGREFDIADITFSDAGMRNRPGYYNLRWAICAGTDNEGDAVWNVQLATVTATGSGWSFADPIATFYVKRDARLFRSLLIPAHKIKWLTDADKRKQSIAEKKRATEPDRSIPPDISSAIRDMCAKESALLQADIAEHRRKMARLDDYMHGIEEHFS